MSDERRYWFVIDRGKLEYVQDNVTGEKITVSELEDLLNEQLSIIRRDELSMKTMMSNMEKLEKEIDEQQAIIDRLQRYNDVLHDENLFNTMKMFEFMKEKGVFDEFYERIKKEVFGNE